MTDWNRSSKYRATARMGFTLVELLVVVSIIALLIAILLPSIKRAREQAKIVVCASQVRNTVNTILLYASEFDDVLPDPSNFSHMYDSVVLKNKFYVEHYGPNDTNPWFSPTPQRLHPAVREIFTGMYGLPREFYYCPSNQLLNKDWWWGPQDNPNVWADTTWDMPMTGYMWLAGRREFCFKTPDEQRDNPTARAKIVADGMTSGSIYADVTSCASSGQLGENGGYKGGDVMGFESIPAGKRVMRQKLSQKSFFNVAVADICYSDADLFSYRADRPETKLNHIVKQQAPTPGFIPRGKGGINVGYLDGSAEWKGQSEIGQPATGRARNRALKYGFTRQYRWLEAQIGDSPYKWFW